MEIKITIENKHYRENKDCRWVKLVYVENG